MYFFFLGSNDFFPRARVYARVLQRVMQALQDILSDLQLLEEADQLCIDAARSLLSNAWLTKKLDDGSFDLQRYMEYNARMGRARLEPQDRCRKLDEALQKLSARSLDMLDDGSTVHEMYAHLQTELYRHVWQYHLRMCEGQAKPYFDRSDDCSDAAAGPASRDRHGNATAVQDPRENKDASCNDTRLFSAATTTKSLVQRDLCETGDVICNSGRLCSAATTTTKSRVQRDLRGTRDAGCNAAGLCSAATTTTKSLVQRDLRGTRDAGCNDAGLCSAATTTTKSLMQDLRAIHELKTFVVSVDGFALHDASKPFVSHGQLMHVLRNIFDSFDPALVSRAFSVPEEVCAKVQRNLREVKRNQHLLLANILQDLSSEAADALRSGSSFEDVECAWNHEIERRNAELVVC